MKPVTIALCGMGLCAAVAIGMRLSADEPGRDAATADRPAAPALSERAAPAAHAAGMWAWGAANNIASDAPVQVLLAQAMKPSHGLNDGNDPRDKLRQLIKADAAVARQLMANYEKEADPQTRDLIIALLSGVEKPEVLDFSTRLVSSKDLAQRRDGFTLLQRLSSDVPAARPLILQALSGETSSELIMLALAALRPPAEADGSLQPGTQHTQEQARDAVAIVAQLQMLSKNADPNIRQQSLLQLAQWDRTGASQEQWSSALADPAQQVRQAAVTALAQSGTQSAGIKAALLGLANNPNESRDMRGNALQVLERFTLTQEETANFNQLRGQLFGS